MNGLPHVIVKPLLVATLVFSELTTAGFYNSSHNSTHVASPAVRSLQLASMLCNLGSGGYHAPLHNATATNSTSVAPRKSALCRKLAQQSQSYARSGDSFSQQTRERSVRQAVQKKRDKRAMRDTAVSEKAVFLAKNGQSRFKDEAHYIKEGDKYRRVTKRQARKQRWADPEALQADRASPTPAPQPSIAASDDIALEKRALPVVRKPKRTEGKPVRKRSASPVPVVTDCPECEIVEEGACMTPDNKPKPFKFLRNNGVVAIPQFDLQNDADSSAAPAASAKAAEPTILIKKFRNIDGVLQTDTSFSEDGMDDMSIPLPTGDRVTGFTLAKDKLVVQSRPENFEGLSRITTLSLHDTESPESIDGRSAPDLWVRGELYSYYDDTLYTFSENENRVFIYPQTDPDSTHSAAPARIVDLNRVRSAGEELVSVLANEDQTYVAVRKAGAAIKVYQLNDLGEVVSEDFRRTEAGKEYQLDFQSGKLVLVATSFDYSHPGVLACSQYDERMGQRRRRSLDSNESDYSSGSGEGDDNGELRVIFSVLTPIVSILACSGCICCCYFIRGGKCPECSDFCSDSNYDSGLSSAEMRSETARRSADDYRNFVYHWQQRQHNERAQRNLEQMRQQNINSIMRNYPIYQPYRHH